MTAGNAMGASPAATNENEMKEKMTARVSSTKVTPVTVLNRLASSLCSTQADGWSTTCPGF